jgi:hypothetical protein
MDWNGNPICKLILDRQIMNFMVDFDSGFMYTDTISEICRTELPNANDSYIYNNNTDIIESHYFDGSFYSIVYQQRFGHRR